MERVAVQSGPGRKRVVGISVRISNWNGELNQGEKGNKRFINEFEHGCFACVYTYWNSISIDYHYPHFYYFLHPLHFISMLFSSVHCS